MPEDAAMREIDEALLEVSEDLAVEELGGRRRHVWYRDRQNLENADDVLGIPGVNAGYWIQITPTPVTQDVSREFEVEMIGIVKIGDVEMRVDRLAVPRPILEASEFYMNDDPDAPAPSHETPSNYDLLSGQIMQGGGGVRERFNCVWLAYLRKRQDG